MSQFEKLLLTWILLLVSCSILTVSSAPVQTNSEVKIIGGVPATSQEFPFLVSIQFQSTRNTTMHLCGGMIVSLSRVITAAHCLEFFEGEDGLEGLAVVAGSNMYNQITKGILQQRFARKITFHPSFSFSNKINHDIAVIELTEPFIAGETISALPLATRNQSSSGRCKIAGWGTLHPDNGGAYPEQLMKATLTINTQQQCQTSYPSDFDASYQICAGGMNGETVGNCAGDMGGPLICENQDGSKYLAGISSWGATRCGFGPSVYMAIGKYRTWLDSVLSEGNHSTTSTTKATTRKPFNPPEPPKGEELGDLVESSDSKEYFYDEWFDLDSVEEEAMEEHQDHVHDHDHPVGEGGGCRLHLK